MALLSAIVCWQDLSGLWDPTQQGPGKEKQLHLHAHLGPPQIRGREGLGDMSCYESASQTGPA